MEKKTIVKQLNVPFVQTESGALRLAGTRIELDLVIDEWKRGESAETIAHNFDSLTLPAVYAVIAYYLDNRAEVDGYLSQQAKQRNMLYAQIHSNPANIALRERIQMRWTAMQEQAIPA